MAKKSDYSLFINFSFNSLKKIKLFIIFYALIFHYSLFLAHYSLFIIKKGNYSLIIITHPDPYASRLDNGWPVLNIHTVIVLTFQTLSLSVKYQGWNSQVARQNSKQGRP